MNPKDNLFYETKKEVIKNPKRSKVIIRTITSFRTSSRFEPPLTTSNMSSINQTTTNLARSLLGTLEDSIETIYNLVQFDEWTDMIPEPRYLGPRAISRTASSTMTQNNSDNVSTTPIDDPRLIICQLNVKEYKPEDLQAMKAGDHIVIRGNHGEKRDEHSLVSRKFIRRILIPKDMVEGEIKIHLFSDGILSITAKKRSKILEIPIKRISKQQINQQEQQMVDTDVQSTPTDLGGTLTKPTKQK